MMRLTASQTQPAHYIQSSVYGMRGYGAVSIFKL